MDVFHNLLYRIAGLPLHGPTLRPAIPNRPRIMDVGCGTGHWAVSIGEYVASRALTWPNFKRLTSRSTANTHRPRYIRTDSIPLSFWLIACRF